MSATPAQQVSPPAGSASPKPDARKGEARTPLCFVIDSDGSIRHFLSLIMHGNGIETEEFPDSEGLAAALDRRTPDAVFLNIALESVEAIDSVVALGRRGYSGYVQLMSNRGAAVLGHVKTIGDQHRLLMLPPLKKPFETAAIIKILQTLKLGEPPEVAGRVDLDEALQNKWIEFWYQPKIDLRRKQLVGAEILARTRHPVHGVLRPSAFIPGATETSLVALAERAVAQAAHASAHFGKLGLNLRFAIDVPLNALARLPVPDILKAYRPKSDKWPGLIIDVAEEHVITDLALATETAKKLAPLGVTLAVDNFGRAYATLARLKELPFGELKLDRTFVTDCGTDKVNAPLCKTVIDLAHSFGGTAVAMGIEKAADALALVSMGCDYGQGFLLGQPMQEDRFTSLLRQRAAERRQAAAHLAAARPLEKTGA